MRDFSGWILICIYVIGCSPPSMINPAESSLTHSPHRGSSSLGSLPTESLVTNARYESTSASLSILAWNVESGGNDPEVIARQLAELSGYDIYCLSEVNARNFDRYKQALGADFASFNSSLGRGDRLQIIFNKSRFELLQKKELSRHGDLVLNDGNHRSPSFIRVRDRDSKAEFIVMTNHLARVSAKLRTQQAIGLREWARDQNVPIINIGDFNMDFDFPTQRGNDAFVEILRDNVWMWVKPKELIDTNWSAPLGDPKDR